MRFAVTEISISSEIRISHAYFWEEFPMSKSDSGGAVATTADAPDQAGKFSISEDWLAVVVGLVLLGLVLTGLIPQGLIP